MWEQGKSVRRKEQQRGAVLSDHNRHSPSPEQPGGRRKKNQEQRSEAEPGKKPVGEVFTVLSLCLSIPLYFYLAIYQINFPPVESGLPVMVVGE